MEIWKVETVKTVADVGVTETSLFTNYSHAYHCFNGCKTSGDYTTVRLITVRGGIAEIIRT